MTRVVAGRPLMPLERGSFAWRCADTLGDVGLALVIVLLVPFVLLLLGAPFVLLGYGAVALFRLF